MPAWTVSGAARYARSAPSAMRFPYIALLASASWSALLAGAVTGPASCAPPEAIYDISGTGGGAGPGSCCPAGGGPCCVIADAGPCAITGNFAQDWMLFMPPGTTATVDGDGGTLSLATEGGPNAFSSATYTNPHVSVEGCHVVLHVTPTPGAAPYSAAITFAEDKTDQNYFLLTKVAGALQLSQKTTSEAGADAGQEDVPYDPVCDAWWRIREEGGTVSFETSSDQRCWRVRFTLATPAYAAAATVKLSLGVPGGNDPLAPSTATFDHLNASP